MNAYIAPLITALTEDRLIEIINDVFEKNDNDWIRSNDRKLENSVPRQVLMYCLVEVLHYPLQAAADFVGKSHPTVVYSRKVVRDTLVSDRYYGGRVNRVIQQAENMMKCHS